MSAEIKSGRYRHYKGGEYEVLGTGRHSETLEEVVFYTDAAGEYWVRPVEMWNEVVEVDGEKKIRFEFIN